MSEKSQDYWAFWSKEAAVAGSPLYARLATAIGGDAGLRALAARAKAGQPHPNMLLGAVHFLLLRGAEHPLVRFYPTRGGTTRVDDEDPFPAFADFVAGHRDALAALIESRVTNTNEVGRAAILHPGFRAVAAEAGGPLNLVEIGPSAGLNMIWPRYGVRYSRGGETAASIAPDAPLVIDAELRGENLPPTGPAPQIAARIGLELNPNDLTDPDNRDWLRALVWPEHLDRLKRLEAAMALLAETPPDIRAGDALAALLPTIRTIPESQPVCVYHTIAVYQFSRAMRQTLDDLMTVAGLRRPLWRLGFEMEPDMRYRLSLSRYHDGTIERRALAEAHSHGAWLDWLA